MASKVLRMLGVSSSRSKMKAISVAVFYGTCSISLNFLNKAVVSSYQFNYPFFIMSLQMIITVVFLDTMRIFGIIQLKPFSVKEGLDFLPASLSFALHSTLSLYALHGMNIPMYGAIKRCTPLVSLVLSVLVLKNKHPSALLSSSIGLSTLGCLIASLGDLEFDGNAYILGFLSVFAQAIYLTLIQKCSEQKHRSTIQMIHVNAFNTLPFFLVVSMLMSEPSFISNSAAWDSQGFLPIFVILILSGCVLTFAQFLCAAVCSALTTSMVSVAKSVLQTGLGFVTFGGVKFHPLNIGGLLLNITGGVIYTYVKHNEKTKAETLPTVAGEKNLQNSNSKDTIVSLEHQDNNSVIKKL